jgi:cobalt/nickel transport system permease protein
VILERFSEGSSPLHRIDPRVKVCIALPLVFVVALSNRVVLSNTVVLSNRYGAILLGLVGALFLLFYARIALKAVIQSLRVLLLFILLLWIFLPLSMQGDTLFHLGPLAFTQEGIHRALSISLKSFVIVLYIISLISTSTVFSVVHALHHLKVPRKLVYLAFLSYRYIQVIHEEYLTLKNAMKIRGFRPKTDGHTYRSYAYLAGMLIVRSYDRAERIHEAMLLRGFHGEFYLLHHFSIGKRDILFALFMSIYIFGIVCLEWIL